MAVRWFSMSTQFLTDPKVEELGETHGPAGPLVIVALLGRAKIANDAGRVSCSFRTLAHEAFTDRQGVAGILNEAAENGLLEILDMDDAEVKLRFPAFSRWQDAGRKAEEREATKPNSRANVQTCPEVSRPVPTDRQTDRQDKTEKKKPAPEDLPPDFPADLVVAVDSTLPVLQSIADARGAKPVTRLALAKVIEQYPRHAHLKVARSLDHWLLHGGGEKKPCKDVVARYRNFLDREEPVAVTRPTVQQSIGDRMEGELPDIPRTQIDMHIYRLQQQKRPVTAELIRERHLAVNPERTAA